MIKVGFASGGVSEWPLHCNRKIDVRDCSYLDTDEARKRYSAQFNMLALIGNLDFVILEKDEFVVAKHQGLIPNTYQVTSKSDTFRDKYLFFGETAKTIVAYLDLAISKELLERLRKDYVW